jgi:uncharacterized protein involved in outer membrane biogenesis
MAKLDPRWLRRAAVVAGLVAAFGLIGAFAIPAAARWGLETVASRELGRTVRVDAISANPYTLRVTLKGLRVEGQPGETDPLLSVREATVNASLSSLLRLAPVLDAVRIDGLAVHVVRLEPQRFNFSDIVERIQARPPSDEPARFSVRNIEVADSSADFDDRVTGGRHAASDIRIGIPFLSNLPVDIETTVQPALSGRINGTPFDLKGETRPFLESHESSIALNLAGLDIPKYLAFSPVPLDFVVPAGKLTTDLRIAFRQAVAATKERPALPAQLLVSGQLAVTDFALAAPAGSAPAPLAHWKSLAVTVEEFAPLEQRLVLADVVVDAPSVEVRRDSAGTINWLRFAEAPVRRPATPARAEPAKTGQTPPAAPFGVTLKHAAVRDGHVRYVDNLVGRFEQQIVNLQAEAAGLTTARPEQGTVKVGADLKDNGSLSLDGTLALAPLNGRLQVKARDVRLVAAARYLANVLNGTLDGSSSIDGVLEVGSTDAGVQLALREIGIEGKDIKVRGPSDGGAALDIAAMKVSGGALDLGARTVTLDKVSVDAPRVVVRRLRDRSVNWQHVMRPQPGADAGGTASPGTPDTSAPWSFRMKEAEFARGDVLLEDAAVTPAVKLRASALAGSVKNVIGDGSEPAEFTMRTRFGSGGTLNASGSARWDNPTATVRVNARNLDIAALRPYVADRLNATLAKAELSGRGTFSIVAPAGATPRLAYNGTARLANLHLLDGAGESDLLKWQVLDLSGIDVKVGEGAPVAAVGKVALNDFYARIIVSEQGRLNLADLLKPAAEAAESRPAEAAPKTGDRVDPPSPSGERVADGDPRPTIRIGAVEVQRGNVNFTDNFIKPNYSANMTGLGGTVTTLATDSSEPATMSLSGMIDDDAPVEIGGRLNPLAPTLFLDIEGRTKGVDLPRMTPYAVKYAGYPITKGKLSMEVKYKVEAQKLQASNHLFLDQLTFGDKVDSPTATKLPVLLAVSLLKNSRGEIDINLPISGSLDDPEFSVGGIIIQVIVNLLTKVVTAPFSLLASAFGGSEELGYVEFSPGLATLGAAQVQRLDTLSKALNERPGLRLDIIGRVEPAADTEGVRRAKYEAKLRAAKIRQLTRGGGESVDPATVTIGAEERPALVAAVYSDEAIPDKPRNVIGLVKSIPAPEMEQLILKHMTVTPDDLRALATARAAAVRNHLENNGKVARERLFLVEPKLTAEGIRAKGAPTRVDFSLK